MTPTNTLTQPNALPEDADGSKERERLWQERQRARFDLREVMDDKTPLEHRALRDNIDAMFADENELEKAYHEANAPEKKAEIAKRGTELGDKLYARVYCETDTYGSRFERIENGKIVSVLRIGGGYEHDRGRSRGSESGGLDGEWRILGKRPSHETASGFEYLVGKWTKKPATAEYEYGYVVQIVSEEELRLTEKLSNNFTKDHLLACYATTMKKLQEVEKEIKRKDGERVRANKMFEAATGPLFIFKNKLKKLKEDKENAGGNKREALLREISQMEQEEGAKNQEFNREFEMFDQAIKRLDPEIRALQNKQHVLEYEVGPLDQAGLSSRPDEEKFGQIGRLLLVLGVAADDIRKQAEAIPIAANAVDDEPAFIPHEGKRDTKSRLKGDTKVKAGAPPPAPAQPHSTPAPAPQPTPVPEYFDANAYREDCQALTLNDLYLDWKLPSQKAEKKLIIEEVWNERTKDLDAKAYDDYLNKKIQEGRIVLRVPDERERLTAVIYHVLEKLGMHRMKGVNFGALLKVLGSLERRSFIKVFDDLKQELADELDIRNELENKSSLEIDRSRQYLKLQRRDDRYGFQMKVCGAVLEERLAAAPAVAPYMLTIGKMAQTGAISLAVRPPQDFSSLRRSLAYDTLQKLSIADATTIDPLIVRRLIRDLEAEGLIASDMAKVNKLLSGKGDVADKVEQEKLLVEGYIDSCDSLMKLMLTAGVLEGGEVNRSTIRSYVENLSDIRNEAGFWDVFSHCLRTYSRDTGKNYFKVAHQPELNALQRLKTFEKIRERLRLFIAMQETIEKDMDEVLPLLIDLKVINCHFDAADRAALLKKTAQESVDATVDWRGNFWESIDTLTKNRAKGNRTMKAQAAPSVWNAWGMQKQLIDVPATDVEVLDASAFAKLQSCRSKAELLTLIQKMIDARKPIPVARNAPPIATPAPPPPVNNTPPASPTPPPPVPPVNTAPPANTPPPPVPARKGKPKTMLADPQQNAALAASMPLPPSPTPTPTTPSGRPATPPPTTKFGKAPPASTPPPVNTTPPPVNNAPPVNTAPPPVPSSKNKTGMRNAKKTGTNPAAAKGRTPASKTMMSSGKPAGAPRPKTILSVNVPPHLKPFVDDMDLVLTRMKRARVINNWPADPYESQQKILDAALAVSGAGWNAKCWAVMDELKKKHFKIWAKPNVITDLKMAADATTLCNMLLEIERKNAVNAARSALHLMRYAGLVQINCNGQTCDDAFLNEIKAQSPDMPVNVIQAFWKGFDELQMATHLIGNGVYTTQVEVVAAQENYVEHLLRPIPTWPELMAELHNAARQFQSKKPPVVPMPNPTFTPPPPAPTPPPPAPTPPTPTPAPRISTPAYSIEGENFFAKPEKTVSLAERISTMQDDFGGQTQSLLGSHLAKVLRIDTSAGEHPTKA